MQPAHLSSVHKHELLSPAGNIEAGYAALHYGADAVYLGLTKFSARAGAVNFTPDELDTFTAYAHSLNRKVFVALNTLLTEQEIKEIPQVISYLRRSHVDAVILQDLGVLYLFKKLAPEIELHASTQMAIHNVEGAKFLQRCGFKRVVLARELSLQEIRAIAAATPGLDLEVFIHGALCYSYSGQCLFSALEYGKSANRGCCAYPCRAEYTLTDISHQKTCSSAIKAHLFSMKDLALEEKILKIPALSLKIEGRKKTPLYVAAVTNYYRHILDGNKVYSDEADDIKQIFARPWCQFHFNGKDRHVTDDQFVGHRGLLIGTIAKINKMGPTALLTFKTRHKIEKHDGLQIDVAGIEKPFGFSIKSLYSGKKSIVSAETGTMVSVALPEVHPHLNIGDSVYLASATAVKSRYEYSKPRTGAFHNDIFADVLIEISTQQIFAISGEYSVSAQGHFAVAQNIAKVDGAIHEAFSKTGGSGIQFQNITINNPDKLFVPISVLNELRRQLVDIILAHKDVQPPALPHLKPFTLSEPETSHLQIIPLTLSTKPENFAEINFATAWFRLPQICRNTPRLKEIIARFYQQGARCFIVDNYYGFELLKKFKDVHLGGGSFLYIMNSYAAAMLKKMGAEWGTLALENSADNMLEIVKHAPLKMTQVTRGRPALFTSAVCIRHHDCQQCTHQRKQWLLRQGEREYDAISEDCQTQVFSRRPYCRQKVDGVFAIIEEDI